MPHVKKGAEKQKVASLENEQEKTVDELSGAIQHLISSQDGKKQPTIEEKCVWLSTIKTGSDGPGLCEDHIISLVDVIGKEKFNLQTSKILISCLVPSNHLPEEAVVKAVSWITTKKFPVSLQVGLVKWMNQFYHRMDKTETLALLYGVLFEYLKSDCLCSNLCELFCKMTKKEHVTAYRIKCLFEIESRMGSQSFILALLQIYSNYKPELLLLVSSKFKNAVTSPETRAKVKETHNDDASCSKGMTSADNDELVKFDQHLEDIKSSNDSRRFMKHLNSHFRRLLFTSNLPGGLLLGFRSFLQFGLFTDTLRSSSCSMRVHKRDELLLLLSELTSELQERIPEVSSFVESYLRTWDGQSNVDVLLRLIQHWEICQYNELWETVLQPLFKLFYGSSLKLKCAVIQCLTELYQHWAVFELLRFNESLGKPSSPSTSVKSRTLTVFIKEYEAFKPEEQINALAIFITKLCVIAVLYHSEQNVLLLNTILRFYETVLSMNLSNMSLLLLLPSSPVMASLIFSSNPYILSETCGLLRRYRDAIYAKKQANCMDGANAQTLTDLNKYIIDISNMLGLCNAFERKKDSVFFQQSLPTSVEEYVSQAQESFSIFRHPALFGAAMLFQEQQNEKISPNMLLKKDIMKNKYLQYLSSKNFSGISLFLCTFIKNMALST